MIRLRVTFECPEKIDTILYCPKVNNSPIQLVMEKIHEYITNKKYDDVKDIKRVARIIYRLFKGESNCFQGLWFAKGADIMVESCLDILYTGCVDYEEMMYIGSCFKIFINNNAIK